MMAALRTPRGLATALLLLLLAVLLLAVHGFVLYAHTMVDEAASSEQLDGELGVILARAVRP